MSHLIWEPVESGPLEKIICSWPPCHISTTLPFFWLSRISHLQFALVLWEWVGGFVISLAFGQIDIFQIDSQTEAEWQRAAESSLATFAWMGKADRGHPLPQNTCGCPGIDAQVKNLSITNGRVLFIQKGEWDISWTGARILAVLLTVPAKSKTLWKRQHRSRKHRIALTDYHSHPSSLLGQACDFLFAVLFFRGWVLPASVPPSVVGTPQPSEWWNYRRGPHWLFWYLLSLHSNQFAESRARGSSYYVQSISFQKRERFILWTQTAVESFQFSINQIF